MARCGGALPGTAATYRLANTSLIRTITTILPVGCSFWTRFLISGLNIRLVSAEMEQIRVGQDNVDVTNLSRATDFLQLLHVSSGREKYLMRAMTLRSQ